ncbi:MAG TPA: ABC transporter ATP-binding protein, partial [Armatimonadota bacterium]
GQAVNILSNFSAGKLPPSAAWAQILHLFAIGIAVSVGSIVPTYLRSSLSARAVQRVILDLRCDLYTHIHKLSHSFFDANRSGSLTSRIIGDMDAIQPFVAKAFVQMWMSVGLLIVVLIYFFSQNVYLGLLSIALIPFQLMIQRMIGWKVKDNSSLIRERTARLAGITQERLAASTIVKAFTGEAGEVDRFVDSSESLIDLGIRNSMLNGVSEASNVFLRAVAQLIVVLLGGYVAIFKLGDVTPGLLIQFVLMQSQLYTPIEWLNEMQLIIASALGATDRIFAILDTEPDVMDRPNAVKAPRFAGEIVFENIVFKYPGSGKNIFDGLDLRVPAKSVLALVGPSGGGKTTVTNLLERFYEWESGRILIDGTDIRDYTIFSLRSQIGLVTQEPVLFSGTIEDNILYGRPGASHADVVEAAKRAYAHDFIEEMEGGYDAMLGERGIRLSGGQKQRISIARAFLKDPAILVLDEATSALDSESERIVQLALEELMADRTTLVIAHRLSTVRNASQIAVIDNGRVVESGRHSELIRKGGIYANLCRQQFGESIIEAT